MKPCDEVLIGPDGGGRTHRISEQQQRFIALGLEDVSARI
jgi:hypothetical protein